MIYKVEIKKTFNAYVWQWYWRRNFKRFSYWHTAYDSFDFIYGRVNIRDWDYETFKFCSRVEVSDTVLKQIWESSNRMRECDVISHQIHVASDGTNFYEPLDILVTPSHNRHITNK